MVAFKAMLSRNGETIPGPVMQAIQVTQFNFTNQLHALLSDQALVGNLDYLDVNLVDHFAKYAPPYCPLSILEQFTIWRTRIAARKQTIFLLE
jgi:hypothetical protein